MDTNVQALERRLAGGHRGWRRLDWQLLLDSANPSGAWIRCFTLNLKAVGEPRQVPE